MTTGNVILFVGICAGLVQCVPNTTARAFPDDFMFGVSTSAYQIEGGWDADGKTESIWDYKVHTDPTSIFDHSNGDIAANSYHLYGRDVEMGRELGIDFYRFSLSWTRILPTGFSDKINDAGVKYYNNLIDELLKYDIQAMVTIYHWDLPQKLQELGGWTNPDIITWYGDYARTVFTLFGDKVKYFITINEPHSICYYGYGTSVLAPGVDIEGIAEYLCAKNLLLAHANAYHIYNNDFRSTQNGSIFISMVAEWYEPATDDDVEAAYDAAQFSWGLYAWPIFSQYGDFPPVVKKRIADKSAEQGFPRSRLPELTEKEILLIKGTSDFFGLNHYSTNYVKRNTVSNNTVPSFSDDLGVNIYQVPKWKISESDYTMYVPWGFNKILNYVKDNYYNPPVFITENGLSNAGGLIDNDRVQYYRGYLGALLDALNNGCNIKGYSAWSLMDNFEWNFGYLQCFGLYEVDFDTANRTRTARKSAYVYKEIIRTHQLDTDYEPDLTEPITIDDGHLRCSQN